MKILLATDGSECSMAAVKSIVGRPWPAASQVGAISVVFSIIPLGETIAIGAVYYAHSNVVQKLQDEARSRSEEAVARAHQLLRKARITFIETERLPIGDAREVILDEAKARGAHLIVLGSQATTASTGSCWVVSLNPLRSTHIALWKLFENEFAGSKELT
jgi:nucleotide-binding universal stress UspA family protein